MAPVRSSPHDSAIKPSASPINRKRLSNCSPPFDCPPSSVHHSVAFGSRVVSGCPCTLVFSHMAGEDEVTPLLGSATAHASGQVVAIQGSCLRPLVITSLAPTSFVKLWQARVARQPTPAVGPMPMALVCRARGAL